MSLRASPQPVPTPDGGSDFAAALARCAAGDGAALRSLYDRLAPRMLGVALRLVRRRDLAEEVVHDTFLAIWEKAAGFDPARGRADTWMFAILRHRALNVLRGEARNDLVDDFEPLGLADDGPDAEAIVAALSEAGALRRCLERLDPVRRQAVVLAYTHGLSHGELAGRLGQPLGTVKSWIRRGLLVLRECLA
ncbi:sigma-70 family RNA polymerase sigma factor [Chthonobacter rhizosphaerae]|uniref:sigma-70 family RNA polymerase sigma factor n=1 Tax=Chthonobacter rhizosphaerae TaxID=2735553 RepID=UPI0015EF67EB|nr:sigma-70 family RNA polymerase sigma factor [Chthonobacter rhizosphaerae]